MGILIPPSVAFIVYGIITEESISKLFVAGILPGLILSFLFMGSIYMRVKLNPKLAPVASHRVSFQEKLHSLIKIWDAMVLFICVMGGLFISRIFLNILYQQ